MSNQLVITCRFTGNKRVIPFTVSEADLEATEKSIDFKFEYADMGLVAAAVGKVLRGEVVDSWELETSNFVVYVNGQPKLIRIKNGSSYES